MEEFHAPVNHALNRGIAAYQQIVHSKDEVPDNAAPKETRKGAGKIPKVTPPLPPHGFMEKSPEDFAERYTEKTFPKAAAVKPRPPRARENAPAPGDTSPRGFLKSGGVPDKIGAKETALGVDGIDEARRLLHAVMGPEKGEAFLRKTVPEAVPNPFAFLEDFSGRQLALFFRDESAAAEALALSLLPPKLTAETLAHTGAERKGELVKRIARGAEISPEVVSRAALAMREKVRRFSDSQSTGEEIEIDGRGKLAAILKASGFDFGEQLLGELEKDNPGLSRVLHDRLYTLRDAAAAPDRVIEEKLRSMPDHEIIFLLKNKEEAFIKKIITNLSQGREERIRREAEYMGPIPKIEVEAAARDFLAWFRAEGPWINEEETEEK